MHLFDGKVERHKRQNTRTKLIFYSNKTTRKHLAQALIIFVASTTFFSLFRAEMADQQHQQPMQPANATSQVIMSPNPTNVHLQPPVASASQQLKINSTARLGRLKLNQHVVAPRPAHPRIYRIRAAGANGNFATNAALRIGAPPPADREIEESPGSGPAQKNGTGLVERLQQPQFGARQPSRPHATKVQAQKCAQQQAASLEGETAAEASSVSASSQTLQLAPRPGGGGGAAASQHVVAMQRHKPPVPLGGTETDERVQVVAANERSQSLSAVADTSAAGLDAEAATEIERQTGGQRQQQQQQQQPTGKQTDASNGNLLSLIDEFDSKITTNKTRAALSCDSGEMVIKLNFTEPFKGIVYPDHNRLSPCRFFGDGHHNYELRLPLRGCGTRQVAPRVFVNDVIVRFHKTLELEEDEVKTLICRYPPPLDITTSGSGGQQVAAGNGLVHELLDTRHGQQSQDSLNRPGESALQPNQFELLEPTLATSGQRPTNRFGSGGGGGSGSQLEMNAFGELLAPPGGNQRQPIGDLINLTPAERILLRQHAKGASSANDNLLLAPSGGGGNNIQQRTNSRLLNPAEATSVFLDDDRGNLIRGVNSTATTASASNYFDRLTSIELLFLISSLMFLVLLALGLAGSYFCLGAQRRDRNRRRRRHQPALLFAPQTGGGNGGLLHRKRRAFSPASVASLYQGGAPTTGHTLTGTGSRYQSPSGQLIAHQHPGGHLYNPAAHNRPAYYYQHQYLAQKHHQPPAPSSPDDSDVSGQMLLPPGGAGELGRSGTMTSRLANALGGSNTSNATVAGRRFNYPAQGGGGGGGAHYHASTLRPSRSHHQLYNGVPQQQQQQVVVGRKTTTTTGGQQYPTNLHYGNNTLGRRAGRGTASQASFGPFREPLLKMAPPPHVSSHAPLPLAHANPVAANQTLARVRHARSLQQLREEDDDDTGKRHLGPEHTFGADWLRHHTQTTLDGNALVQRHCSVHARHGHQPHLNDHKIKLKQQQHHYDTSKLAARPALSIAQSGRTGKLGAVTTSQQVASIHYDDDLDATSSSTSCSEGELEIDATQEKNNNNLTGDRQPKLILKSIEDSFVTNFTEIYEQEYKHLDTRRPLGVAEWRDRVGGTGRAGGRGSPTTSSDGETTSAGEDEAVTRADGTLKSSQTNLRSLTELDVNFAKSLLRPSLAAAATTTNTSQQVDKNDDQREEQKLVRHTEQPPEGEQQTGKPPNNNNNNNSNQGEQQQADVKAETPDLVISPEYNVGQRLRLAHKSRKELRPSSDSPGGESISYV